MADLPVLSFIQERISEADPTLELRVGTAFYDLFVKPQEFMLQPLITAMETVLTAQSVNLILTSSNPDQFATNLVDNLVSNVFVTRDQGALATTTVRVFYQTPVDKEYAALTAEFESDSLSFFNSADVVISATAMQLQTQGNFFYLDFLVQAQNTGSSYNLDVTQGVSFINDTDAVSAQFLAPAIGGLAAETNTQVLTRAKNSIGVRDLETINGINGIIQENFPYITEIQAIGMGDPEMQRDILYNAHVGGKTDLYLKTPQYQTVTSSFADIEYDTTRNLPYSVNMELNAVSFSDPASSLDTPEIVSPTVKVTSNTIPTAGFCVTAHVPPVTGLNLSSGQWIKLQLDNGVPINIKVAGANPAATQRFEIINAINAGIQQTIASEYATDQILIQSQTVGQGSQLVFYQPDSPRTDGTLILVPTIATVPPATVAYSPPTIPGTFLGNAPIVYLENIDYQVDYTDGKIINLLGSILSGRTIAEHPGLPDSGPGVISTGNNLFSTAVPNAFSLVQVGDEVFITASTGVALGSYIVTNKINNQSLRLLAFTPTANDTAVQYYIVSHQVVVVTLQYNPLSIDIGPNVLLSDGVSRGIRPGRENFTITDVAFVGIISVEETDPITGDGLGIFLNAPGGFGSGGFGVGSFGLGAGGDYRFVVNDAPSRFSAFEDSLITFNQEFFGQSFNITYYAADEVAAIHAFCRDDGQRVTGADVLPKTFVPAFVDMTINVRPNTSNINTPTNAALVALVSNYVNGQTTVPTPLPIDQSEIGDIIISSGITSVQMPFTMTATVFNPDGSTTIISSTDELIVPSPTLPSETSNYTSQRITHWYPRNIVITGV